MVSIIARLSRALHIIIVINSMFVSPALELQVSNFLASVEMGKAFFFLSFMFCIFSASPIACMYASVQQLQIL